MQPISGTPPRPPGEGPVTPNVAGEQPLSTQQRTVLERLITRLIALTSQQNAEVWAGVKHDLGVRNDAPLQSRHFPAAEQNLNQRITTAQQNHTTRQIVAQLTELFGQGNNRQAVSDFIRLFNVKTPSMEQAIGLLSGGNQQKVAIARGLMTRPKVLILDEPTRGVDVGAKKEIYQLINQFKADGLSIILVSSEMPEVLGMSDRIIVMHEGHLGGEFTREQATQEVLMAAAVGKLNRVNQE